MRPHRRMEMFEGASRERLWGLKSETMALYEYLCRDCETSFEVRRSMSEPESSVTCPSGHTDVRRKLSMFASVWPRGMGTSTAAFGSAPSSRSGGGCCGGACGCGR